MSIEWKLCNQDEGCWDEYLLLLLHHYEELSFPYGFEMALSFIGNPMVAGNALIAQERESGRTVAALGFVFGTGQDYYENERVCQLEALYIASVHRGSALYLTMLRQLVTTLQERYTQTETIQFWAPSDREDLRRLFGACFELVKTNEKDFGRIDLFTSTVDRLAAFCKRI
ncbi:hypothetical protein [Paenibacillus sp. YYML68]|uniref:hypothetical protein n=1 Tax=Paenibacillus sp. YYML68 TaxID=2909250 RepID=UPI002490BC0B|nr:hypothetical protein [Paenibacillus sp. YYML68]